MSSVKLLAIRARQLQRREEDLVQMAEHVRKAGFQSIKHFKETHQRRIKDFDFKPGALALVHNSKIEMELDCKSKEKYYGPMVVVHRSAQGSYRLAELDGEMSRTSYTAFWVIPYYARGHRKDRSTGVDYSSRGRRGGVRGGAWK